MITGDNDQQGTAVDSDQQGTAGDNDQQGTTGDNDQQGTTGDNDEQVTAGDNDEQGTAGDNDEQVTAGDNDEQVTAGDNDEQGTTGDNDRILASKRCERDITVGFESMCRLLNHTNSFNVLHLRRPGHCDDNKLYTAHVAQAFEYARQQLHNDNDALKKNFIYHKLKLAYVDLIKEDRRKKHMKSLDAEWKYTNCGCWKSWRKNPLRWNIIIAAILFCATGCGLYYYSSHVHNTCEPTKNNTIGIQDNIGCLGTHEALDGNKTTSILIAGCGGAMLSTGVALLTTLLFDSERKTRALYNGSRLEQIYCRIVFVYFIIGFALSCLNAFIELRISHIDWCRPPKMVLEGSIDGGIWALASFLYKKATTVMVCCDRTPLCWRAGCKPIYGSYCCKIISFVVEVAMTLALGVALGILGALLAWTIPYADACTATDVYMRNISESFMEYVINILGLMQAHAFQLLKSFCKTLRGLFVSGVYSLLCKYPAFSAVTSVVNNENQQGDVADMEQQNVQRVVQNGPPAAIDMRYPPAPYNLLQPRMLFVCSHGRQIQWNERSYNSCGRKNDIFAGKSEQFRNFIPSFEFSILLSIMPIVWLE